MPKVTERLIGYFEDIRNNVASDIEWFDKTLSQVENCFEFLRKRAMATRAHLIFLGNLWPTINLDMDRKEFIQRVTISIWSNFVFSLSYVEYFLKNIIKATSKGPLLDWFTEKTEELAKEDKKFWMYLHGIVKASKKPKLVTKAQLKSWSGMIYLRNAIIHNNGIFEKDRVLRIGRIEIVTKPGEEVETMLINYPRFIKTLISLTRKWIEKYIIVHKFH